MSWLPFPVTEQIRITKMFSFFRARRSSTYEFGGEAHNFWECLYVLSGSICVSADERVYNLSAGELIFHKPLELHKYHTTGNKDAELLIFSFDMEGALCHYFYNKVFSLLKTQEQIIHRLLSYMEEKAAEYDTESAAYYLLPGEKKSTYLQTVVSYLHLLMLSLADNSEVLSASTAEDSVLFSKAVSYMNERICENPSVEEIAKHTNISTAGLKRIFKRYASLGVHQYFLKLKLKAASQMLACGSTVTETAEKLGFSSQGYFSAVFKRETGTLPSSVIGKKAAL